MAKVLVFEQGKEPYTKEVNCLEDEQEIVGGLITAIYPVDVEYDSDSVCLIGNDESKLLNLEPIALLRDEDGQVYDCLNGTFFLTRCNDDGDAIDVTDDDIRTFTEWWRTHKIDKGSRIYNVCKKYVHDNFLK